MSQEKLVEDIVRQVLESMYQGAKPAAQAASSSSAGTLSPAADYPLSEKRPELIKTPTGKHLNALTLENVLNGTVTPEDVRISAETLRLQAQIADGVGRTQFGNNLRRAAELTAIPDKRILEIYNALRPHRSTKEELLAIADEMETKYSAVTSAALVREAADVYERRNQLRAD